jgi:N-formylglutamate deformylase
VTAPGGGSIPEAPFLIYADPDVAPLPVVAHVPHSSHRIPDFARPSIVLRPALLWQEIVRMTDWHTDQLFSWLTGRGAQLFVASMSRLVFDPERFVDDYDEPMSRVGQGVVYTMTSQGELLRDDDAENREALVRDYYRPYHAGLEELVAWHLDQHGRCLILDCHSFATTPLPSEPDQAVPRPDVCIGTDPFHTPPELAEAIAAAFTREGLIVGRNRPFAGTMVPAARYRTDARVSSVMIEVRRGLYCDEESGAPSADFDQVRGMIERAVVSVLGVWLRDSSD